MGFVLPLYTSLSPPTSPPLSSSPFPIDLPPSYPIMSQYDLHAIICQQQEQLAAMQAQIQALLAAGGGGGAETTERATMRSDMGSHMEVAKPAIFNREAGKVGGFVIAYRLYLRMKIKEATVEEQV